MQLCSSFDITSKLTDRCASSFPSLNSSPVVVDLTCCPLLSLPADDSETFVIEVVH